VKLLINGFQRQFQLAWLCGIVVLGVSSLHFEYQSKSLAQELLNNWLEAEAINLQQGNLLSSIAKSQRILLSSDLVEGISLFEAMPNRQKVVLASFGKSIDLAKNQPHQNQSVERIGFGRYLAVARVGPQAQTFVAFAVHPRKMLQWFLIYVSSIIVLTAGFVIYSVRKEKHEARSREKLIESALRDFVSSERISPIVLQMAPLLVQRWSALKSELTDMQEKQIKLAARAQFADLARQLAHDIRSPITALNFAIASIPGLGSVHKEIIDASIKRINSIAQDVLFKSTQANSSSTRVESQSVSLNHVIQTVLQEKTLANQPLITQGVKLDLNIEDRDICVKMDESDLLRVLSNLVGNAIDAVAAAGGKGHVMVSSSSVGAEWLAKIVVEDSGCGIPKDLLKHLGEHGFSYGKRGNGLGLHHAKKVIDEVGGSICIESELGVGTRVVVTLPVYKKSESIEIQDSVCFQHSVTDQPKHMNIA